MIVYRVIVPEFASLLATLQVAVGGVFTIQVAKCSHTAKIILFVASCSGVI